MTDETLRPKWKRWRWVIAGVLLFVVGAAWSGWPRRDSRFVGNWSAVKSWDSRFLPESLFFFEPDEVTVEGFERPPTLTIAFRWKTSADALILQPAVAPIDRVLAGPFAGWRSWMREWFEVEDSFDFRFENDAHRVLFHHNGQPVVLLERIPE